MRWLWWAVAAHTAVNAALLRRLTAGTPRSRVSVLLPVRDEEHRVRPCLESLLRQGHEVLVLDDASRDGTADLVRALGATLLTGAPLPPGWLGKPHACQQLADAADPASEVLVFVDADVVLAPGAVDAAVALMERLDLDLVSPYPRQEAPGLTRLVQPLQQWSWLALLPLRWAERSHRTSLTAATGQFLVVRRSAYDRAGGHAAVRDQVVEDLALLRHVKQAGGRGVVVDGTRWATCRMYDDWRALADGYGKSLHELPAAVPLGLAAATVLPLLGRHRGQVYAAMTASRAIAAWRTGAPVVDALAHPASVVVAAALWVRSRRGRAAATWKGRPLGPGAAAGPVSRPARSPGTPRAAAARTRSAARSPAPRSR